MLYCSCVLLNHAFEDILPILILLHVKIGNQFPARLSSGFLNLTRILLYLIYSLVQPCAEYASLLHYRYLSDTM